MTAALLVGVLVTGGVYMMLSRELLRVTFGFTLLGHAVNVLFIAGGGLYRRDPALLGQTPADQAADPLPQAFVLTAIVITFGVTVYLLALMRAEGLRRDGFAPDSEKPAPPDGSDDRATAATAATGEDPAPAPAAGTGTGAADATQSETAQTETGGGQR